MKIVAFAGSSSRASINKQLVTYAASLVSGAEVDVLDLNDYELPLFSVDREKELGQPEKAKAFLAKIAGCDALIISLAEHNSSYSASYKNLLDWCSRINPKLYQDKPLVLLATSPGKRGGATVLAAAVDSAPRFGARLKGNLSIPSFDQNFDPVKKTLVNEELRAKLTTLLSELGK